jgi:hypothetical protein
MDIKKDKKFNENFINELKKSVNYSGKRYVTKKLFNDSVKHYYSRVEQKLSETKADIFKWFIKTNIAQTSILIALMFTLLDFYLKK